MLDIVTFVLGPAQTNAYLIADTGNAEAVVIDPAWDGKVILDEATRRGWRIAHLWLTHAHFDHLGGAAAIVDGVQPQPPVALHPADQPLWRISGGAAWFGVHIDPGPEPSIDLAHGQVLRLGSVEFEVRHVPGHTPGHVLFYSSTEKLALCGDVLFAGSIGRTDFPGGDFDTLIRSIHEQILTMPDETRLLSGHGPETKVGQERRHNPFLT